MDHSLTELKDLLVEFLLLLNDMLPPVDGSLKLIDDSIEGGVGPSCPLETLRDAELLAVDLVQDRRKRG